MVLFYHSTANPTARHTAHALQQAGVLSEFWSYVPDQERLVLTRIADSRPDETPLAGSLPQAPSHALSRALDDEMKHRVERESFGAVYACENAAEATFRAAREKGMLRIYDLPRGHWRGSHPILDEEAHLEPSWAPTLDPVPLSTDATSRSEAELRDSDLVFVSSTFGLHTVEQIEGAEGAFAVALPGAPRVRDDIDYPLRTGVRGDPLRVLYVGALTQRSGLSYVFRACRSLGRAVTLTIVAPPATRNCAALTHELDCVRWLATDSPAVIEREMQTNDVLLHPAIYDAGSHTMLEALARGMPVIATPNSAGPDLINDGVNGFLVPIRSADTIAARLELLHREPELRAEMSRQAAAGAQLQSWNRFERIVGASVAAALGQRG